MQTIEQSRKQFVNFVDLFKLEDLEEALKPHKDSSDCEAVLRYYFACKGKLRSPQLIEPVALLKQTLELMLGGFRLPRESAQQTLDAPNLSQICDRVEDFETRLRFGIEQINTVPTAVPKNLHFVWLGGGIGAIQRDYLNVWRQVMAGQGYTLNLWYDSDALLAYQANKVIVEAAKADALLKAQAENITETQLATLYEARAIVLKQQMFAQINAAVAQGQAADEARIDLLSRAYGQDAEALEMLRQNNRDSLLALHGDDLQLRDLGDASQPLQLQLKDIYQREIRLRGNLAAASDVVRAEVLFNEGGLYADVDNLPPLAQKLGDTDISTWGVDARLGALQLLLDLNPTWMPGRAGLRSGYPAYLDRIPAKSRVALETFGQSAPPLSQVFQPPAQTMARPHELRAVTERASLSNAFLLAHPGAAMLDAVIKRMRFNYAVLDEVTNLTLRLDIAPTNFDVITQFARKVLERTYGPLNQLSMEDDINTSLLASAVAGYFSDGIRLQSDWTIYLTGPTAMRVGIADYERQHLTPDASERAREELHIDPLTMVNRATEEELDHSWKDNETDEHVWLANEQARWRAGQYPTRYQGDLEALLMNPGIAFEGGWPVIEGRAVLLTDILQRLVDELGEPFIRAMQHSADRFIRLDKPLPLSFDDRQAIKSQPTGVFPPASLSSPLTEVIGLDEMLGRIAKGTFRLAQASPLQRLTLGMLLGAQALDNRSLDELSEDLDNLANSVSELGASSRYAVIERQMYKRRSAAFMAGIESVLDEPPELPGSALALKEIALMQAHTPYQWGRHVAKIRQLATLEYREKVLDRVEQVLNQFDASAVKLVPQDLLLQGPGEALGGRCYPLALVMSAALSRGESASRRLRERFFLTAIEPGQNDSRAFLDALEQLRDVPVKEVGTRLGRVTLAQVSATFERYPDTCTLMLNSDNHAMLLAKTVDAGQVTFHFYDPNFGLFEFANATMFEQALKHFFLTQGMAGYYAAYGTPSMPEFDLIEIRGQDVADLSVSTDFKVAQLLESDALPQHPSSRPIRRRLTSAHGQSLIDNAHLGRCLLELDSRWWGQQIAHVTAQLQDLHESPSPLVPVFDTLQVRADGGYQMSLFDPSSGDFVRQVVSDEHRLLRIKNWLSEQFSALAGKPATLGTLPDPTDVSSVHTLNAGFTIQALMNALRHREGDDRTLTLSVRLHAYVNYAQLAHGSVVDLLGVAKLVKTALSEERVIARTCAPVVGEALGHVANEGAGAVLGLANVGFDIYQLATAQSDLEIAQVGTQLAFDASGLALTGAGLVAAATGAATAAAVLGGVGVIFGGLAVGVSALAQGFASIARDAQAVGLFFDTLQRGAYGVGYRFDDALKAWVVEPSSLGIECVDLKGGVLKLRSPKLFRLRNHFGVPGYDPKLSNALDIAEQLGLPDHIQRVLPVGQPVVLPCLPQTYYGYEYKALPFASSRHDSGFDLARRLEKKDRDGNWQFLFSFYSFPSHYIVHRLFPAYQPTVIKVLLDAADRELVVPRLPQQWQDLVTYALTGAGATCRLSLSPGVKVRLLAPEQTACRWIVTASWVSQEGVKFSRNGTLDLGGVEVRFAGAGRSELFIKLAGQRLLRVDLDTQTLILLEDTAPAGLDESALLEHYKGLARDHRLTLAYTPVHRYLIPFEPAQKPRYTTAWYDATEDRFVYVRNEQVEGDKALLGAVSGGFAYFYEPDGFLVWQVDAVSGLLRHVYRLLQMPGTGKLRRVEADADGVIHVVQEYRDAGKGPRQFNFLIHSGQLLLSSATHDMNRELSAKMFADGILSDWEQALGSYHKQSLEPSRDGVTTIDWEPAAYVSVCWKFAPDSRDMVWIRERDRLLIHPVPRPKRARGWADSIKNLNDLMLLTLSPDSDVFMIYNRLAQRLCRLERTLLEGLPHWSHQWVQPQGLREVLRVGSGYVALTENGLFFNLNAHGDLQFGGLTEKWLHERPQWWQALDAVATQHPVDHFAVCGLRNMQGEPHLGAWYVDQRLLLNQSKRSGDTRLLGVTPDRRHAWLFEPASGELGTQAFVDASLLAEAFGDGARLLRADVVPPSQQPWDEWRFADVTLNGSQLRGVTVDGVILALAFEESERITGVNHAWVARQGEHLIEGLQLLLAADEHEAFVSVESGPGRLQWYDVQNARLIQVAEQDLPPAFNLLGTRLKEQVLLHDRIEGFVHALPKARRIGPFDYLQRNAQVLVVEGHKQMADLTPLLPDGVDTLLLRLGQGAVTFHLSRTLWLRLASVIVDCRHVASDALTIPGKLNWALDAPDKLQLEMVDDHLVVVDPDSQHSLIFRDAGSADPLLRGEVFLGFDGKFSVAVSRLVRMLRERQATNPVSTLQALLSVAADQ